jgi:hypothetical protein
MQWDMSNDHRLYGPSRNFEVFSHWSDLDSGRLFLPWENPLRSYDYEKWLQGRPQKRGGSVPEKDRRDRRTKIEGSLARERR